MKKCCSVLFLCLFLQISVFAGEIPVILIPVCKISTSDTNLREGDSVNFLIAKDVYSNSKIILKKGQKVTAIITSLEDNDILLKPASIYIENFKTQALNGNEVKLKGIIFKKGNEHKLVIDFFPSYYIRGGEAHIFPEKDKFILYLENKK